MRVRNDTIKAGVPQGSVLDPLLHVLYISNLFVSRNTAIETFADDTAILATNVNPTDASTELKEHVNTHQNWFKR